MNWLRSKIRMWLDIHYTEHRVTMALAQLEDHHDELNVITMKLRNEKVDREAAIKILTMYANEIEARVTKLDGGRLANLNPSKEVPEMYKTINADILKNG